MATSEIEEFGKTLVQKVRDAAIQSCDRQLYLDTMSPIAKRWRELNDSEESRELVKNIIPDIVDETICYLLQAIDQELLRVSYSGSTGKIIDLSTDGLGELSGWYMGSDGWRALYAKERFIDDFADLK